MREFEIEVAVRHYMTLKVMAPSEEDIDWDDVKNCVQNELMDYLVNNEVDYDVSEVNKSEPEPTMPWE